MQGDYITILSFSAERNVADLLADGVIFVLSMFSSLFTLHLKCPYVHICYDVYLYSIRIL